LNGQARTARAVTIMLPLLTYSTFSLQNVACLTGYSGALWCEGLGAWEGKEVGKQVQIADPWDQVSDLTAKLDKFDKLLNKHGAKNAEELDNLIGNSKQNAEHHQPGDLKPLGLPADWQQQIKERSEWISKFPNQTAQGVKDKFDDLENGPSQQEFDDLEQNFRL